MDREFKCSRDIYDAPGVGPLTPTCSQWCFSGKSFLLLVLHDSYLIYKPSHRMLRRLLAASIRWFGILFLANCHMSHMHMVLVLHVVKSCPSYWEFLMISSEHTTAMSHELITIGHLAFQQLDELLVNVNSTYSKDYSHSLREGHTPCFFLDFFSGLGCCRRSGQSFSKRSSITWFQNPPLENSRSFICTQFHCLLYL